MGWLGIKRIVSNLMVKLVVKFALVLLGIYFLFILLNIPYYTANPTLTPVNIPYYVFQQQTPSFMIINEIETNIPNGNDTHLITGTQLENLGNITITFNANNQTIRNYVKNIFYRDTSGVFEQLQPQQQNFYGVSSWYVTTPSIDVKIGEVSIQTLDMDVPNVTHLIKKSVFSEEREFNQKVYIPNGYSSYTYIVKIPKYKIGSIPLDDFVKVRASADVPYNYAEDSDYYIYIWNPETNPPNKIGNIFLLNFSYEYFFDYNKVFLYIVIFVVGVFVDDYLRKRKE